MVKQHDVGRHLADVDVRAFLRQLLDVVIHCVRHPDGSRGIREVWFEPRDGSAATPVIPAPERAPQRVVEVA